ncbi:MAG: SCO family protein [Rudaea sp.]
MRGLVLACALALPAFVAAAPLPPVDRVGFAPPRGASLPADASFADEHGRPVRLGDLVSARPAIVVPAYYGCSNLCTLVLRGVAAGLAAAKLRAGRDVDVVAVSIDPHETPALALQKKRALLGTHDAAGWHFLTGQAAGIERVTRALGYRYAYVAQEHQYAHASGVAIVAPHGRVVRVLYGVAFSPADLRAALALARGDPGPPGAIPVQASAASTWLLCFHYDPRTGRYTFAAMNAVRVAGLLALVALVAYALRALRRERRARTTR